MRPFLLKFNLALCLLAPAVQAAGFLVPSNPPPAVTLAWDAGTNVASYKLYWGVASRSYTNAVAITNTQVAVTNLVRGTTYYFAATALDSYGLESDFSSEVSYTTPAPPNPPTLLPPVVLTVESRPAPGGLWNDAGMYWALAPEATNQLFRLRLTR